MDDGGGSGSVHGAALTNTLVILVTPLHGGKEAERQTVAAQTPV